MSEELTRKKKVRGGHRASAKRILGEVQTSISSEPPDIARIAQLQQSIENKLQTLAALDEEILALTEDDAVEEEIVSADQFKELLHIALSAIERVLKPDAPSSNISQTSATNSSAASSTAVTTDTYQSSTDQPSATISPTVPSTAVTTASRQPSTEISTATASTPREAKI
ncbi:hypothetical protein EMCRGX_G016664 [Ephydatia muelleri]